jgi:Putative zincin peptidase
MLIPGFLIALATFPGVIVHEMAHQLFCRWFRVPVFDACYFRIGNPSGYVIHEKPRKESQQIWIGVGPFLVNTIVGALVAFPGVIPVLKFDAGRPVDAFFIWLGISIAMHAFPSTADAKSIWKAVSSAQVPWLGKLIAIPVVALIYLGAIGSFFWLDAVYGVVVAIALPNIMTALLA